MNTKKNHNTQQQNCTSITDLLTCCAAETNTSSYNVNGIPNNQDYMEGFTVVSKVDNNTNDGQRKRPSPATKKNDSIGAAELMGIGLSCGSKLDSVADGGTLNSGKKKGFVSTKFASAPIRSDSIIHQSSLLSLYASETIDEDSVMMGGTSSHQQQQVYKTPPRRNKHNRKQTTPTSSSSTVIHSNKEEPESPAMELSKAKLVANNAQHTFRKNYRYREQHSYGRFENGVKESPPKKARNDDGVSLSLGINNDNLMQPVLGGVENVSHFAEYENASPPPIYTSTSGVEVNAELISTYQYPRVYLSNPIQIISTSNNTEAACGNKYWWFHLVQQMGTTIRHVQDDYYKGLISQQQQSSNRRTSMSDSVSAESSSQQHQLSNFGCTSLERTLTTDSEDGCVAMTRDLCIGQEKDGTASISTGSKSHRKTKSWSKSSKKSSVGASSKPAVFNISSNPINVWSEPHASTMKVRGETYAQDGIKVDSDESIFSILGVDSFVSSGSEASSSSWGTQHYLSRWKMACKNVGINQPPPFMLIINFIVPWGNFQAYLIRPSADDGPFSSKDANSPSEKAWSSFMKGDTEYRNKRLKLIPRVCAGPWMIKKMVGATPALIGTKLPVTYNGSIKENYLEIKLDVTKGPAFGNSVANTVVGKSDVVTVDLGFVIEGSEEEGTLPEQILGLFRLHHLNMKACPEHEAWGRQCEG